MDFGYNFRLGYFSEYECMVIHIVKKASRPGGAQNK